MGLPGRENDDICIERAPVLEFQARLRETGYLGVILEFNLPVDYQLARADICASHTVGGRVGSVKHQESGAVEIAPK